MGVVHRFSGQAGSFDWEGVPVEPYDSPQMKGVCKRVLIGPRERAPHFVIRYFEVEPGGHTSLDVHSHEHGVLILRGRARVRMGEEEIETGYGDAIFIPGNELHQFHNIGEEPLGFLCVIPAR